jgi:hypothetical protein
VAAAAAHPVAAAGTASLAHQQPAQQQQQGYGSRVAAAVGAAVERRATPAGVTKCRTALCRTNVTCCSAAAIALPFSGPLQALQPSSKFAYARRLAPQLYNTPAHQLNTEDREQ